MIEQAANDFREGRVGEGEYRMLMLVNELQVYGQRIADTLTVDGVNQGVDVLSMLQPVFDHTNGD